MSDIEIILATTTKRCKNFKNLIRIKDCSDIFIETKKNLELQSATLSDYKHQNTIKFLAYVAPNSTATLEYQKWYFLLAPDIATLFSAFMSQLFMCYTILITTFCAHSFSVLFSKMYSMAIEPCSLKMTASKNLLNDFYNTFIFRPGTDY